jgi:hypothetical protein
MIKNKLLNKYFGIGSKFWIMDSPDERLQKLFHRRFLKRCLYKYIRVKVL